MIIDRFIDYLTFTTLWANSADAKLKVCFVSIIQKHRIWHFMQIVSTGDNLHEMPKLFSGVGWGGGAWGAGGGAIFQYVVCWKMYQECQTLNELKFKTFATTEANAASDQVRHCLQTV